MSLQLAAQHLAAQGRGPDKQLVHMSPREVAGLQALAMAHGGSLSINPDTGLPEAGFLDNLLPTIIGAGLAFATGGASAAAMPGLFGLGMPATIGLGVGALQTARTGNLGKGLMAGLGAYGGAGLTAGLMGAGAGTIDATQTALGAPNVATGQGSQAAMLAAQNEGFGQAGLQSLGQSAGYAKEATPFVQTPVQSVTRGVQGLFEKPGREAFMKSIGGGKELTKLGLAAAAPALLAQPKTEMPKADQGQPYNYAFDPGRIENPRAGYPADYRGEYEYFRPSYTRLAGGGPVEAMSDANAVGANTGYPMANISRGAYATPYQQPISQNVVTGSQDTRVDALTGAERFADGGDTDGYRYEYDPVRQVYKQSLPPTTAAGVKSTSSGDMRGDGGGSLSSEALSSGREIGINPFSAIAAGEAIQGFGRGLGGFMPGGMLANAIGGGLVGYGQNAIAQNQANLDAEMGASMGAAQNAAANEAGISAAFGGSDSSHAGSDHGAGIDSSGMYNMGGITALARGGYSHLGDYSDGGRLLRGPGDGVSDSIPAVIGQKRPARLADGEFVIPARIVSELGNGSTEAGARKLYAMMDRVQRARGKTTGKGKVAKNTRSEKYLPA